MAPLCGASGKEACATLRLSLSTPARHCNCSRWLWERNQWVECSPDKLENLPRGHDGSSSSRTQAWWNRLQVVKTELMPFLKISPQDATPSNLMSPVPDGRPCKRQR